MPLNQVLLEGTLGSPPRNKPSDEKFLEFTVRYEGGVSAIRSEFFTVEIWNGWSEEICELLRTREGETILVVGHLRRERDARHPSIRIRAIKLKRLQSRPRPGEELLESVLELDASGNIPF